MSGYAAVNEAFRLAVKRTELLRQALRPQPEKGASVAKAATEKLQAKGAKPAKR